MFWFWGGFGKTGEYRNIGSYILLKVFIVYKLSEVTILPVIFHSYILMLMIIVFIIFSKPYGRKSFINKAGMIATAKKSVISVD